MVNIDLQGHRGARGLLPENTIPAFLKAMEFEVQTLELDLAIDVEGNVIVSHEPWMSAVICSHPDGSPVSEDEQKDLKIWEMTFEQIQSYDCGMRGHSEFPKQTPIAATKPKLTDVFTAVKQVATEASSELPAFNIEIKSSAAGDGVLHPPVNEFVSRALETIKSNYPLHLITIQAFDARALERVHDLEPDIAISWLVGNEDGWKANMDQLTFIPDVYSPAFRLIDSSLVSSVHEAGMLLIPWTVNEVQDMRDVINLGVDGFITDYPDRGRALLDELVQEDQGSKL